MAKLPIDTITHYEYDGKGNINIIVSELVRCKDCDYADYSGMPEGRLYCLDNAFYWSDDDFCSKGVRSGKD